MTLLDALILGIVEGITEFLPVSSTGHLILASSLLDIPPSEFLKTFEIAIQLGAIASVFILYFKSFFDLEIIKRLLVAFVPTGVLGLIFYEFLKTSLLGNQMLVVTALLLGGIALIAFEYLHTEHVDASDSVASVTYKQALIIGLFQAIAIIPGVSRSAASIIGGLLVGIKRTVVVEFSFLLAAPTILAASALDLVKTEASFGASELSALFVGFITSLVVAVLAIRYLLAFVREHTFIPFGVYRIGVALVFMYLILL